MTKSCWRSRGRYVAVVASALAVLATACGGGGGTGSEADGRGTEDPDTATSDMGEDAVDGDAEYELSFATLSGPQNPQMQGMELWAEKAAERTDGRLTVEMFYQGALLSGTDAIVGVGDGRADMGWAIHAYNPGELPLSTVSELPYHTDNPEVQLRTFTELYETNEAFRSEWEAMGVTVLFFHPLGGTILGSEEPIEGVDDLQGKKIRGLGYTNEALALAGADPVAVPAGEVYESVSRGVVDGYASFPFEGITAQQLQEVAPYVQDPGLGSYILTATVINTDLWESMPQDIRDVIIDISDEYLSEGLDLFSSVETEVCDAILDEGGQVTVWSEAEQQKWADMIGDDFVEDWISRVSAEGLPAQEFYDQYVSTLAKYEEEAAFVPGVQDCAERSE